jgi:hypothetical protein
MVGLVNLNQKIQKLMPIIDMIKKWGRVAHMGGLHILYLMKLNSLMVILWLTVRSQITYPYILALRVSNLLEDLKFPPETF